MNHDVSGFPGTARYVPVRLLGAGGMGAVYEVEDRRKGTHVALKVMLARDAARLLRFKQEFRVMADLYHPNLVRLFDLEQHEGQWFFTMELVRGQDLVEVLLAEDARAACSTVAAVPRALISDSCDTDVEPDVAPLSIARSGRLACDPEVLVRVVLQVLDALEFLHGRGILHRDLKPSNILVDVDGMVRLLDFGLASRVDRAEAISHEGAIVGTLAYLSPEQYRGEPASAASDLYALGCMMFQLLTGELPFQGSPMEALAGRTERPPPRVDERVPDAPPHLVEIVHRLMAMSPAERATIAQVREALGAAPPRSSGIGQAQPAPASGVDSVELFVGRDAEVSALARCLEHATEGEPQIALVSGPSGIGKSALADVAVRRARRLGFLCFPGRCYEREQVPFVAFDRVVDAMVLTLRAWPAAHLAALKPSLVALERIFPAVSMLTASTMGPQAAPNPGPAVQGHPRASSGVDPRELRRQALDGFRSLCTYAQAVAPLCFVLDDLQWADEESVALLSALLDGGAGRIMVVGLFRREGVGEGHPLHGLLQRLSAEGRATTIVLAPLGSTQAAELVQAVTRSAFAPETSAALASQAGGNPFLVRRLAEHLLALSPDERAARLDDTFSADDLLRTMIHALSPRAQSLLVLAATAGSDISPSLLRRASELEGGELDLALGELLSARFLRTVQPAEPDATPHLDVYHDRIREVAYGDLDLAERRALHLRLARAIEAQPAGRARDAELLVRHFGAAGERALERRYAVEAAERAADKLAFARAARLFRIVLDDPDPAEDPLTLAARWEKVGDLHECSGQHIEAARAYQEAQRRWDAAPEVHPDRAVARLRLRGLAGVNLTATRHVAEGRAVLESGFSLLGLPVHRPPPERLAVLAALKLKTEIAERVERVRGAIDALPARAGGRADPFLAAEVGFLDMAVRAFQPLWPGTAAEAALRAELLGRRIDDKRVLQRSLAFGAAVPVWLGPASPAQIERAHRRLDVADELARAHDIPLGHEIVQLNRSLIWLPTNMARARRSCEAALEGFARRGLTEAYDGNVAQCYYLYVLLFKGDDDDALALAERELSAERPNFINVALFLDQKVMLLCRRGRLAEARETLARLEAHIAGVPMSRLNVLHERARGTVLLFEGRFAEALAQGEVWERASRESGTWGVSIDRSLWLETGLEAALGLLRRGALGAKRQAEARASAEWLARNGVLTLTGLGYRALALLAHAEGRPRAAAEAVRRALMLTSANASPRHRWLALEAARDVGTITRDQEVEADELAAAGRFVWPEGWVTRSPARN